MDTFQIITLLQIGIFIIILFLALLYVTPILFLHQFHRRNNILTLNICLTTTATCIYFIIYFILYIFNQELLFAEHRCHFVLYVYNISSIGIPFSFITLSVYRFFPILYCTKQFFRTKKWLTICILIQWTAEFIISLPFVLRKGQYCTGTSLMSIYTWTMAVLLPLLINFILNFYIFLYVRSSSRRITPQIDCKSINNSRRQPMGINRRDIHLFLHVIVMFSLFIFGWGPVYTISCLRLITDIHVLLFPSSIIVAQLCLLGIIIDLFVYNHPLRHYLWNQFRQCFSIS